MANQASTVTLTVGGTRHEGWTRINVTRSIDALAGSFDLTLATAWAESPAPFVLEAGAACTVSIGGETLITGYIDRLSPSFDSEAHSITISGRDKSGDLIDCAAIASPGTWRDTKISTILTAIAKPYGVKIILSADEGAPLRRFSLQPGETVQAAIERLCRFRGLLAIPNAQGDIELTTPNAGAPAEVLTQGGNIVSASGEHDVSGRFSEYIVKGQSSGDDRAHGKTVSAPHANAKDPAIKRHRPMVIIAEEQATLAGLQTRARWEASTREGKGQSANVQLQGWYRPDGKLRDRNTIVMLGAPHLFMDGRMLVQSCSYILDEGGTRTELIVVPPSAWSQLPVPEKAEVSRVGRRR